MRRVVVEGGSGYAGMELVRLPARHPDFSLCAVTSSRWAGSTVRQRLGLPGPVGELVFQPQTDAADVDGVFLATPDPVSEALAPRWLGSGARVVDLSRAFRADPKGVYGLTELHRAAIDNAALVANPGCYPTAAQLALVPLLEAGLLAPGPIVIDAKSGVSGAGRRLDDSLLFNELADNHYPYRVGDHPHVAEIERGIGREVLFTPHLLPTRRGLLDTIYAPLATGVTPAEVAACWAERYANEPFVFVATPDAAVGLRAVIHTPNCHLAVGPTVKSGMVRLFASLDNLLKGAASQALQNMNRMLGSTETAGLI